MLWSRNTDLCCFSTGSLTHLLFLVIIVAEILMLEMKALYSCQPLLVAISWSSGSRAHICSTPSSLPIALHIWIYWVYARKVYWNKCISSILLQPATSNLSANPRALFLYSPSGALLHGPHFVGIFLIKEWTSAPYFTPLLLSILLWKACLWTIPEPISRPPGYQIGASSGPTISMPLERGLPVTWWLTPVLGCWWLVWPRRFTGPTPPDWPIHGDICGQTVGGKVPVCLQLAFSVSMLNLCSWKANVD